MQKNRSLWLSCCFFLFLLPSPVQGEWRIYRAETMQQDSFTEKRLPSDKRKREQAAPMPTGEQAGAKQQDKSNFAVVAFINAVLGLLFLILGFMSGLTGYLLLFGLLATACSIVGLVMGPIGLKSSKKGLAVAAIILSLLVCLLGLFVSLLAFSSGLFTGFLI